MEALSCLLKMANLCLLLMWFEAILGLKVNMEKSKLILVGSMENVEKLAQEFG